jgi:hypothetical protein
VQIVLDGALATDFTDHSGDVTAFQMVRGEALT